MAAYAAAVAIVALAIALRHLFDPFWGSAMPFVTVFGGVAVAVWLTRWRPAAVAALVGYAGAEYFLVAPRLVFKQSTIFENIFGYALSAGVIIAVGEALHRANDRARDEIARRRRTEEQLRESQQRLELALQAAYTISFEWDIRKNEVRRFISLDPALPPTPTTPSTFEAVRSIVHPDDQALFTARVEAALADPAGRYESEFRIVHPGGDVAWLHECGCIERGPDGQPARLLGLSQDVTARRAAQEDLRRSEERFRSVLESSLDAAYRRDLQRDAYDFLSPRIQDVLGIPAALLSSMPLASVLDRMHPGDRERVDAALAAARRSNGGRVTYRFRGDDGRYRWLEDHFTIQRDANGEPLFRSGSIRDITEQKRAEQAVRESEERFRGVFENAAAGVAMVGMDGRFIRANDTLCRMIGCSHDELLGRSFADVTHPDDLAADLAQARRLFAGQVPTYTMEKRYIRKDGTTLWVNLGASLQRDRDGRAQYGIAVVTDISERKRAEAALAEANVQLASHTRDLDALVERRTSELRDLAQQLETFSYSIVHDLRAPLRSMRSFAALLEQECAPQLDATARDYLQRIIRAAERMDGLITDVLAYSRATRSNASLSPINLDQLVTEIIQGDPQFQEHAAAIAVERPLPLVNGNAALLTQVISNLIANALKFVPPGQAPHVTIGAGPRGDRVRVWVQDQGIGIPAEYRHKLFGLFQRLHAASEYPGTGVGLATVKKAIERMGGDVGFESEPNAGSRFWFELAPAERPVD